MSKFDMKDATVLEQLGTIVSSEDVKATLKIIAEHVAKGATEDQLYVGLGFAASAQFMGTFKDIAKELKNIGTEIELTREAITENTKAIYNHTEQAFHRQR